MGFWNETCMLSKLPIRPETPCAGILIARRPEPVNKTYADGFYAPVSRVFFGKYDSFGALTDLLDKNDCVTDLLPPRKFEVLPYEPDMPDMNHTAEPVTGLESLLKAVERGRVFINTRFGKLPVYLALMHEDLFEYAVETARKNHFEESLLQRVQNNDQVRWFETSDATLELGALLAFMTTMRIGLMPTIGAGSQYELDNKRYAMFYKLMYEKAQDIHGRYL